VIDAVVAFGGLALRVRFEAQVLPPLAGTPLSTHSFERWALGVIDGLAAT